MKSSRRKFFGFAFLAGVLQPLTRTAMGAQPNTDGARLDESEDRRVLLTGVDHGTSSAEAEDLSEAEIDAGHWTIETAHGEIDFERDEQTPFALVDGRCLEIVHIDRNGTCFFVEPGAVVGAYVAQAADLHVEMIENEHISTNV